MVINFIRGAMQRRLLKSFPAKAGQSKLLTTFLLMVFFSVLHMVAMVVFEGLSLFDSLWLTVTTLTTVGYGDISASTTLGRLATIFFLYLPGIYLFANFISEYVFYKSDRLERKAKGLWRWKMDNHILIINTPEQNGEQYFERLVDEFKASDKFKDTPIQLLTSLFPNGLPESLRQKGVVHTTGRADSLDDLNRADAQQAAYVIVLSKTPDDKFTDGRTFNVIDNVKSTGSQAHILAECVDDTHRERLLDAGAKSVLRPVRSHPAMLVSSLIAPGAEQVLEDAFSQTGAHYERIPFTVSNQTVHWHEICCDFLKANIGSPCAYIDNNGKLINSPDGTALIQCKEILVLANRIVDSDLLAKVNALPRYM